MIFDEYVTLELLTRKCYNWTYVFKWLRHLSLEHVFVRISEIKSTQIQICEKCVKRDGTFYSIVTFFFVCVSKQKIHLNANNMFAGDTLPTYIYSRDLVSYCKRLSCWCVYSTEKSKLNLLTRKNEKQTNCSIEFDYI